MSTADEIKTCCASAYSTDVVAWVLGESYHPGGAGLTRILAERMRLRPGQRVADIACGPGPTALLLAAEYGVTVNGVDLAESLVDQARANAHRAGLSAVARFAHGDAERLPWDNGRFDAVISECAFCTLPDKATAAAEFARVLRPDGLLGLADVTVSAAGLPRELSTLAAWAACVADARPLADYLDILARVGLRAVHSESHDDAVTKMIDRIEAWVRLAQLIEAPVLKSSGVDTDEVLDYLQHIRNAVVQGIIGYSIVVAERA